MLEVTSLPKSALDAATHFHAEILPQARELIGRETAGLTIHLPAADYDHDDWRRGAVRDLARAFAPKRVNLLAGGDEAAVSQAGEYLASAPGVTGQLLNLAES